MPDDHEKRISALEVSLPYIKEHIAEIEKIVSKLADQAPTWKVLLYSVVTGAVLTMVGTTLKAMLSMWLPT